MAFLLGLRVSGSHVPKASILGRRGPMAFASISWGPVMFAEWTDYREGATVVCVGADGICG